MSWAKMCKCFPCCRKPVDAPVVPQALPHNLVHYPQNDNLEREPSLAVIRATHHKYTSTLVDIRGALSTPIAP